MPKKGYKLVKGQFGKYEEIPEEWEIKKFDEVFEFLISGTNARSDLGESGDIQYIHYGDIHTKWKSILDCNSEKIPWISKTKVEKIPLLKEGDLIIVDASEDYDGSGTSILLKNIKNKKIVSGLHTFALRNKDENISLGFKAYLTSMKFVKNQIISYVTGTSVYGLSKKNLKNIKISLPTVQEQQKISSILSHIDNLLISTQKIIFQITILKKGLMQKLLTKGISHKKFKKVKWLFGKEIEIPEEWEIKKIDEVFEFLTTATNSRSDLKARGDVQYIHYGDIHTKWKTILDCSLEEITWIDKDKIKKISLLKEGDLIIVDASEDYEGSGTSILLKNIKNRKIVSGLHTIALRDNGENVSLDFKAYLMSIKFVKSQIIAYVTGVSIYGLSKKNLKKIKIPFPPLPEQQKIASILSDVDSQIQSQIQYKEKLERLRKSLMQKLLTGEVRITI